MQQTNELSLCNKVKYLNPNILRNWCCKPLIFQALIIWFNRIYSLKYIRSVTFGSKDIVSRKSEFLTMTQFKVKRAIININEYQLNPVIYLYSRSRLGRKMRTKPWYLFVPRSRLGRKMRTKPWYLFVPRSRLVRKMRTKPWYLFVLQE